MFEIFVGTKFKFMEKRRFTYVLSVLLVLASLAAIASFLLECGGADEPGVAVDPCQEVVGYHQQP